MKWYIRFGMLVVLSVFLGVGYLGYGVYQKKKVRRFAGYPYVSSYQFESMSDIYVRGDDLDFPFHLIRDGDIVFLESSDTNAFTQSLYKKINAHFVLVSPRGCDAFTKDHHAFLDDERVIAVFAKTVQTKHPKLHPIPAGVGGVSDQTRDEGEMILSDHYAHDQKFIKKKYFSQGPGEFRVCSWGGGMDPFDIFETLIAGNIPVMQTSYVDDAYAGLPILFVQDTQDILGDLLGQLGDPLSKKEYSLDKLFTDYWYDRMYVLAEPYRGGWRGAIRRGLRSIQFYGYKISEKIVRLGKNITGEFTKLFSLDKKKLVVSHDDYPYLTRSIFQVLSDFRFTGAMLPIELMRDGDIVHTSVDNVGTFLKNVHPHITTKYVLISQGGDNPVSEEYADYLDDETLVAWFAQNVEFEHPKLINFPIGMVVHPTMRKYFSREPVFFGDKKKLLYGNFGFTHPERIQVKELFQKTSFCKIAEKMPLEKYLQEMRQYKFVLSPRGNGWDCYRTWEILASGAIPVVQAGPFDQLYKDLPVLIVENWEDITPEFLKHKWRELSQQSYNTEKNYVDYWVDSILVHADRARKQSLGQPSLTQRAKRSAWKLTYAIKNIGMSLLHS